MDCLLNVFEFVSYDTKNKKFTYYDWPGFAREKLQFANAGNYNSIQKFVAKGETGVFIGYKQRPGKPSN